MKVSIIVPVWGVEKWIERCVESLMQQTYDNLEFIFVDDCSPDSSVARLTQVINRYPNRLPQVTIMHNERNMGVGCSRRIATEHATGDVLMHVDGDDFVDNTIVEKLVNKMIETHCDIVECGFTEVADGSPQRNVLPAFCNSDNYLRLLLCQNMVHNGAWGRLMKRSLFTHHVNFVDGINYGDDYAVIPCVYLNTSRAVVSQPLYFYNVTNDGSYTHHITDDKTLQYISAANVIWSHFNEYDTELRFNTALNIGMLNVVRHIRRFGNNKPLLYNKLIFTPNKLWAKALMSLFKGRLPLPVTSFIYRSLRKVITLRYLRRDF